MKNVKMLLSTLLLFISLFTNGQPLIDTAKHQFTGDIPLDKKGKPKANNKYREQLRKALDLNYLEDGFDSIQIRLWYQYAFSRKGELIILKNIGGHWSGQLLRLRFGYNSVRDSSTCEVLERKSLLPVSGWRKFIKQLFALNLVDLPNQDKIKSYPEIADGDGIAIEVANKLKYRFYSYQQPSDAQKTVPEAKKIEAIMNLIDDEFKISRLRKF